MLLGAGGRSKMFMCWGFSGCICGTVDRPYLSGKKGPTAIVLYLPYGSDMMMCVRGSGGSCTPKSGEKVIKRKKVRGRKMQNKNEMKINER